MSRGLWTVLGVALLVLGRGLVLARQLLSPLPGGGDRLLIAACVSSIPGPADDGWRFDAHAAFPQHPQWPVRELRVQLPAGVGRPLVGDCWQYAASLGQPAGAASRRILLRDHFSGYARVVASPLNHRLSAGGHGLDGLRERLARRVMEQVADPSAAALVAALAVGATGDVTARQWQVFNATGITHLVAISGMHVTFFAVLAMFAARHLWRWCAAGTRRLPRRSACAAAVGAALALLYALLSGASVPAQRTVVMLAAVLAARECARRTRPGWSIGVALAVVLLLDPMAPLGAGFWLSFVAVAVLVLLAGGRLQSPPPLAELLQLQWMVGIALLPFTVAVFGTFPAVGLLVNLLAIPVFSLLLVPPILIATACCLLPGAVASWCGDMLLRLAGWIAAALWPGLCWCAALPGALWRAVPPWSWYPLALVAALLALLPLARRTRLASLALLVSAFLLRAPRPATGELWLDATGQGGAATVLLRTQAHLLLLGTGETYHSGGRGFARQVLPLLRAAGYARIDLWLPGAWTRDTQAALRVGAAELPVGAALLPPPSAPPPELRTCGTAASWRWDGLDFELRSSDDSRACELTVARGAHRMVLGGAAGAHFTIPAGGSARLVFDAAGLGLRAAFLGL